MPVSLVQSVGPAAAGSGTSLQTGAFTAPVTTGNTLVVFVLYQGSPSLQTITGVTDTAGNTYVKDETGTPSGNHVNCDIWRASNVTGGSAMKVTVTASGATFLTIVAAEFSGLVSASPLDGSGSTNGNNTATAQPNTGAFSTTNPNDLLLAAFAIGDLPVANTLVEPTGFTRIAKEQSGGTFVDGDVCYQVVAATQTNVNPTWSGISASVNRNWVADGLAYKAAGGGPWPFFFDSEMSGGFLELGL